MSTAHSPVSVDPSIPPHIATIERPKDRLLAYYVIKALCTTVAFPAVMPVLFFRYHTMRYRFDAEGIHMKWGILFKREIMLNYSRIQDIHLRASLLERLLGLARIEIQTAAGTAGGAMTLEGLEDHDAMRDFLYSRMRGYRQESAVREDDVTRTLREIAGELRAVRLLIQERAPRV